ncbi:hypothetical protein [uncultured Tateyamaria sp.]|uniref:hypothetical protein n=1 Tax=Tateyamaria sp. 1078 TaxID=3417464 RepID=UPI0026187AD0|nr:hypothetical protein [uncultured Tateyamaria sp.]
MKKRRLVLHVGLPKAASSSLQWLMHNQSARARADGVDYPALGADVVVPKHQALVPALMSGDLNPLAPLLADSSADTVMLSTEGLTNHFYDFDPAALARFREMVAHWDVTLFMILRDPDAWTRSYYAQAVINPAIRAVSFYATPTTLEAFARLERVRQLCDHDRLAQDLHAGFGAAQVVTARLEDNWQAALAQCLGLPWLAHCPDQSQNITPAPWVIALMRQVNAFRLPEPRRLAWKAALQQVSGSGHTLLSQAGDSRAEAKFDLEPHVVAALVPSVHPVFPLSAAQIAAFKAQVT